MTSPRIDITFAGQQLVLDAMGVLYWPQQEMLVVSDMHLEKSTYFATRGAFIAPYDTQDTLERLASAIDHYKPRELLLLGDSFHDAHAWERLDASLRAQLAAITSKVAQCSWVEGNHDRRMLQHAPGSIMASHTHSGLVFNHEHDPADIRSQIIGHYHPKIALPVGGRKVRGPCFVVAPHLLVMPAFGSYTGGLDVTHPTFQTLLGSAPHQLHLLFREQLYSFAGHGPGW